MYYVIVTQSKEIVKKARKNGDKILPISKNAGIDEVNFVKRNQQAIITQFLTDLGIATSLKGFHCLKYIINRSLNEPGYEQKPITRVVYPDCAKELNTTWNRVERAIRHAIESSYKSGKHTDDYIEIFGELNRMPTNDNFISTVVLYIRENLM